MNLLDRLVLREILWPLAVGLLAILQLLVVVQLLQLNEIVFGTAVTLFDIARMTAALAPHFLVMAVPLAFMLGIQLGIGRLAGDQELLAISAAGVHPARLYRVPLAVSLALGLCVAALAHWAEPWGLRQLSSVLTDVIRRNLEGGLTPGVFNDALPRFLVYVQGTDGKEWKGVLIEDQAADGSPLLALAETGHLEESGREALRLRLSKGELHRSDAHGETVARFAEGTFRVDVQGPLAKHRFAQIDQALSRAQLREKIAEADKMGYREDAARLRVELVRRSAVPLACLAFVVLGVPLAIVYRGARGGAYIVTLAVFIVFYALSRISIGLAQKGLPPTLAGFLPNLVVFAAGVYYSVRLFHRGVARTD